MSKNILILTIDDPLKPFGGLGVSILNMIKYLPEYNFFCFGICEKREIGNIRTITISSNFKHNQRRQYKCHTYL